MFYLSFFVYLCLGVGINIVNKKKTTNQNSEFKVDFPTTVIVSLDMRDKYCMYMWEGNTEKQEKQVPFIIKDIPKDGVYFAVFISFVILFSFLLIYIYRFLQIMVLVWSSYH
jgi:hypothetical protein